MMKQTSLAAAGGFELKTPRTRKQVLLSEMQAIVPPAELVAVIAPCSPTRGPKGTRPPVAAETVLRIHFLQHWFGLSDPTMKGMLYDVPRYRQLAGLYIGIKRLPDERTVPYFRYLLEERGLSARIFECVNTILTDRGLIPHIGTAVDAKSGLGHTMVTTPTNTHDITQTRELLHGQETYVFADSGYRDVHKPKEVKRSHPKSHWHIAVIPGKRRTLLDRTRAHDRFVDELECAEALIWTTVEHPFRMLKRVSSASPRCVTGD